MKLNPDIKHVQMIQEKLKANGGHCPCMPTKTKDTICPCKYMRELSVCRCGLYVQGGNNEKL